jgi:site-specific DNA-adenine methylase
MIFIEPCAGSAAMSLYLCGASRAIVPYQGSKWRYRQSIAQALGVDVGLLDGLVLTDVSPWAETLDVVFSWELGRLSWVVNDLCKVDPRDLFNLFTSRERNPDPVCAAAEFLFLQRLAFSGKAVGLKNGKYASPGFNPASAYGKLATPCFGAINPMIPSLASVLQSYTRLLKKPKFVTAFTGTANPGLLSAKDAARSVVYIDPPYVSTTKYPDGDLTRQQVIELALSWQETGAKVAVSEAEPIPELKGWIQVQISSKSNGTSPFKKKNNEFIMVSR